MYGIEQEFFMKSHTLYGMVAFLTKDYYCGLGYKCDDVTTVEEAMNNFNLV